MPEVRHQNSKMTRQPTVLSTFAGTGGSSLGYQFAGFREVLAVEWDHHACDCLRANFPGLPIFEGDIAKLTVDEALRLTGLKVGELDVFDTSPPCQSFSTFGARKSDDPRAILYRESIRLIAGLRPKTFVLENVKGLTLGKMKLRLAEILHELKAAGYKVKARVLNAMYYGVPQSRERLIIIGVRSDLGVEPSFPAPRTMPMSVRAALADVKNDDPAEVEMLLDAGRRLSTYRLFSCIPPGKRLSDIREKKTGFSCRRLHPDKPSRTICKNDSVIGMHGLMHPFEQRRLTVAECKRLASFPDDFRLPGTWAEGTARIGNCVPPRFMQAIAENIRDNILAKVEA